MHTTHQGETTGNCDRDTWIRAEDYERARHTHMVWVNISMQQNEAENLRSGLIESAFIF